MIDTIISSGSGVPTGDILNLIGIGILLLAGFHYVQYRNTTDPDEEAEARRAMTMTVAVFLFYAVVAYLYWGDADSWVVQLGGVVDTYFEQLSDELIVEDTTEESGESASTFDQILSSIQTIGLIAYVLLFGATAVVAKTPIIILDYIFG